MPEVQDLCNKIVEQQRKLGMKTPDFLLPGMSIGAYESRVKSLPFHLPESAKEMYLWSEGLHPSRGVGTSFCPYYGFESLSVSVEMYLLLSSQQDFPRFANETHRWFPMFHGGSTDFLGIVTAESKVGDGEVYDDMHDDSPEVAYLNLESMLRTVLAAFEQGIYYIDSYGSLNVGKHILHEDGPLQGHLMSVDLSAFKELARKYNPGVPAWDTAS